MGKKKECRNFFQIDLRKERSPYIDADPSSWTPDLMKGVENLLSAGFTLQALEQPKIVRVDSYRPPPLKLTLETIVEEDKLDLNYQRSKSLPAHRRASFDCSGQGLNRLPSYRHGQGVFLARGCSVSKSGPILSSSYDFDCAPQHRSRISKMRETLRNGRFRQVLSSILSRMRPASRGSH